MPEIKIIDGKTTIFLGKKNDATVYATDEFTPLSIKDLDFTTPEYIIKYDSGVYPSIADLELYMCKKAQAWFEN